jgi:hypothetical protein
MKTKIFLLTIAAISLPIASQASQIVNIDALSSNGTSVQLSAGTYDISVIGTAQGGQYNAWDYASANFGTPQASPAPNAWVDSFDITVNGVTNSYLPKSNPLSSTALGALSTYESSVLYTNGTSPASSSIDTVVLTLNSAETVNFTVADDLFCDNWGGTSLQLTNVDPAAATPEPSTFGLIGLALTGSIAALRRKLGR